MPWVSLELPWQTGEEAAKIYTVSTPGSQLFAAINVCMRNSCGCASPRCVPLCCGAEMGKCVLEGGGPKKVTPGKLLLLQGEDRGCTDDGEHGQLVLVRQPLCRRWEGAPCGLAASGYSLCLDFSWFPSLPAGERGFMRT